MKSLHFASYDRPLIMPIKISQFAFTAGAAIQYPVPRYPAGAQVNGNTALGAGAGPGMGGRVLTAFISRVTTDFAGATTDAGVRVGDGTTVGKYFDSGLTIDETVDANEVMQLVDTGNQVDIEAGRSTITITLVAAVGTPAGVADVDIWVAWWQGRTV